MHRDLDEWLNQVWDARDRLIRESLNQGYIRGRGASAGMGHNEGAGLIYDMYNATTSTGSSSEDSHLTEMRRMLVLLENGTRMAPIVQSGDHMDQKTLGWMAIAELSELRSKFFHYAPGNSVVAQYRIYINCKPEVRGEVFKSILLDCGLAAVRGVYSAKVSSPDDGGRVDTIVIYVASGFADAALDCVERYHTNARGHFGSALPKLVAPARGLQGVGTAMEPPGLRIVSTGGRFYQKSVAQSFGAYRSELIFMALERTRFSVPPQSVIQRKAAFKKRVEKYFRKAGIDPANPALQGAVDNLPDLALIKDWTNKHDTVD